MVIDKDDADDLCRACHGPGGQRACVNCGSPMCSEHNPFVPPDGCEMCLLHEQLGRDA